MKTLRLSPRLSFTSLTLFLSCSVLFAQSPREYVTDPDPVVQQRLTEWQDLKLGLLMHWGPYAQWGIVESWSICSEDEDWCRRSMD